MERREKVEQMKREFSAGSLKILQREYPALDQETANDILTHSKIHREAAEPLELAKGPFDHVLPNMFKMEVPDSILYNMESRGINLETFISIYPDKDGILYIQYPEEW